MIQICDTESDGFMNKIVDWSREIQEELAGRNLIVDEKLPEENWEVNKFKRRPDTQTACPELRAKLE